MATATPNVGTYGEPCVAGHTVVIYDRGGTERVNALVDLASVTWQRKLSAKTVATIVITGRSCIAQTSVLNAIKPKRHEIRIYRGGKVVWEGPIMDVDATSTTFTITANDICAYLEGTALSQDYPAPGVPVTRYNLISNPSGFRGTTGYTSTSANLSSTSNGGLTAAATAAATVAGTILATLQTYTVGTAAGNLLPNTTYTFSAMMGAAVGQVPWQLFASGAGLAAAVNGSALTVDSAYHAASISFTTAASGTVSVGFSNNGVISIGNFFTGYYFQLELGTGATSYLDGDITSTGAQTFAWTGTPDASSSVATTLVGPPGMTDRIKAILNYELTTAYEMITTNGTVVVGRWEQQDPPANVLPYIDITSGPTQTTVATTAFQMSVAQHLYNLAGSIGVSFVTVGRMLRIWDGFLSQTVRKMTENDITGDFDVIEAGEDFWAIQHVSSSVILDDGDPLVGHAISDTSYYGPWENVATTISASTTTPATQGELNSQANSGLAGLYPVPWELVVPDGALLIPSAGLDISDLVPGTNIPVNAAHNIKPMNQTQQLITMNVTEDSSGEKVTITLGAATATAP